MATKGERGSLEPIAIQLYTSGRTLEEISQALGVSTTSLRKWKSEALKPGTGCDEWDRARMQRRSNSRRIKDLFERELKFTEELPPGSLTPQIADSLSKLGALVERMDKMEKAQAVAESVTKTVKKAGLSDEATEIIRKQILGIGE